MTVDDLDAKALAGRLATAATAATAAPEATGEPAPDGRTWARGDYSVIARLLVGLGGDLVRAAGVTPVHRVLDVAAGSGNAAIAAAELDADVTASDLTPKLIERGRREAAARGVSMEWLQADAELLPFPDDDFDVVLSCIGAMFAPDQAAVARELLRVCRPGGTVALANWTAGGAMGRLFALLERYAPTRPEGALAPTDWGDPDHVRALFGDRVARLETHRRTARLDFTGSPAEWCALYRACFAPVVETYERLGTDPKLLAALDDDLLRFAAGEYLGPLGGPGRYEFEYLLVLAEPAA
ncbi:class I SAM-dependent methyltransferase [Frankia sp. QA3]|uniref:class I SAM-dependent methyltransferase n=1 Tax=Frankia sp. QA3 TaxID=710111 RepID=UPI000269CDE8|nr:class I SAM-dependent methyltransferase [Frankia sp. QA3]EIV96152.1 methylase involved in ubiquinone/menaquinone biosynthesis [Frankia sp. QA3]